MKTSTDILNKLLEERCEFFSTKHCLDWIKEVGKVSWDEEQMSQIVTSFKGTICEHWIWNFVILTSEKPIPIKIVKYLYDNDIGLSYLSHTTQEVEVYDLIKDKSEEAAAHLVKIYYEGEEYSESYFLEFINNYHSHTVVQRLIHSNPSSTEKREIFRNFIHSHSIYIKETELDSFFNKSG